MAWIVHTDLVRCQTRHGSAIIARAHLDFSRAEAVKGVDFLHVHIVPNGSIYL